MYGLVYISSVELFGCTWTFRASLMSYYSWLAGMNPSAATHMFFVDVDVSLLMVAVPNACHWETFTCVISIAIDTFGVAIRVFDASIYFKVLSTTCLALFMLSSLVIM